MGTDIIYQAEKFIDGKWDIIFDESGVDEFFYFGQNRNYELFEILCGSVDPETGLTSRGFEPIAPRRGLPNDYPPSHDNPGDDPGYSWLLLRELIDFPWEEKQRRFIGYANAKNYQLFFNDLPFRFSPVSPKNRYSSVELPKPAWKVVTNEEMFEMICNRLEIDEDMYTLIEFSRPYSSSAPQVLTDTIPKLSKFGDADMIRIVFSFF